MKLILILVFFILSQAASAGTRSVCAEKLDSKVIFFEKGTRGICKDFSISYPDLDEQINKGIKVDAEANLQIVVQCSKPKVLRNYEASIIWTDDGCEVQKVKRISK